MVNQISACGAYSVAALNRSFMVTTLLPGKKEKK